MTESIKPLHVRVAESLTDTEPVLWHYNEVNQRPMLGPNPTGKTGGSWAFHVCMRDPGFRIDEHPYMLFPAPYYDQDWSATGPLIEKYCIEIARSHGAVEWHVPRNWIATLPRNWIATSCKTRHGISTLRPIWEEGDTPLIAVCNLIIALHEAGRLHD